MSADRITYRLKIDGDKAKLYGYEVPEGKVIKRNRDYIIVKYPGHSYWNGAGLKRGYEPVERIVYQIVGIVPFAEDSKERIYKVQTCITF